MKQKISVTIDEKTVLDIFSAIQSGKFRNKSHVVEFAVKKLLEYEIQNRTNKNQSDEGHPLLFAADGSRIVESKLKLKNQEENGRST